MTTDTRRQITVSYAVLALLAVVAAAVLVMPALNARSDRLNSIQAAREVFWKSQAAITDAETLLAAGDWTIDPQDLLQAETDALAAAALQQMISGIVDSADAALVSMAHSRNDEASPLTAIPVAVRLRASVAGLTQIFLSIEQSRPVLFISEVAIQSRHQAGGRLQSLTDELDVQFNVSGFLMPAAASP